jgi:hypothetical protein
MKNDNPSSYNRINEKQDYKFLLLLKRLVEVYGRMGERRNICIILHGVISQTLVLLVDIPMRHINFSFIFLYKNESSVKSLLEAKFSGPCVRTTYLLTQYQ